MGVGLIMIVDPAEKPKAETALTHFPELSCMKLVVMVAGKTFAARESWHPVQIS